MYTHSLAVHVAVAAAATTTTTAAAAAAETPHQLNNNSTVFFIYLDIHFKSTNLKISSACTHISFNCRVSS